MVMEAMESGIVLLAFLAAIGAAIAWAYRKIIAPIHHKVERILALVDYELKPNGGGSLVDRVNYIAQNHRDVALQAEGIAKRLEEYQHAVSHRLEKIELAVQGREP